MWSVFSWCPRYVCTVTGWALCDRSFYKVNAVLKIINKPSVESWPSAPCRRGSDTLQLPSACVCAKKNGRLPRLRDVQELANVISLSAACFHSLFVEGGHKLLSKETTEEQSALQWFVAEDVAVRPAGASPAIIYDFCTVCKSWDPSDIPISAPASERDRAWPGMGTGSSSRTKGPAALQCQYNHAASPSICSWHPAGAPVHGKAPAGGKAGADAGFGIFVLCCPTTGKRTPRITLIHPMVTSVCHSDITVSHKAGVWCRSLFKWEVEKYTIPWSPSRGRRCH